MHRFKEGSRKQDCRHKNNPKHSNEILSLFISVSVPTIASQTATDYKLSIKKNNTQDWKHLYLLESSRFHFGSCNVQKTVKIGVQESAWTWSRWWWYSCCNSSASSSCCCWNIIGKCSCSSAFYSTCSSSIKPVSASSLPSFNTVTLHICYCGRMRCFRRSWSRVGMRLMLIIPPAILSLIL